MYNFLLLEVKLRILNSQNYFQSKHFVLGDTCKLLQFCRLQLPFTFKIKLHSVNFLLNAWLILKSVISAWIFFPPGIQEHGFQRSNDWCDVLINKLKKPPRFPQFPISVTVAPPFSCLPGLKLQSYFFGLGTFVQSVAYP